MANKEQSGPDTRPGRDNEGIVDHARLVAQGGGVPSIEEMARVLDELISLRLSSMRAGIRTYGQLGDKFDLRQWGRDTYVLEHILARFQRQANKA
jgi:hypothetical protein